MRIHYIIAFTAMICFIPLHCFSQITINGTIKDAATGEGLPGATIYFPELKNGTSADMDGKYQVTNLPAKTLSLQITYIGYNSITTSITLSQNTSIDFSLDPSVTEMKEIVITGQSGASEANRTPSPITVVTKASLLQNTSTNIVDALATQPGISQVSTGPAISKPEIRGLGYNRVLVVNDGIRQEGQQWGDEHGIEIDEYSVNRIEILKGPASLSYGSDAMAGVIHFITAPTLPDKTIKGNILSNYQTNNGLIGYSGNIAGNLNGFIWDARYSGKLAHAYQNKYDGWVAGSNFNEQSASAIVGLNKKWGYAHLHTGIYHLNVGLTEGERDSITGAFILPVAINDSTAGSFIPSENDLKSYNVPLPWQQIDHYKAALNSSILLGDGAIDAIIGWQQNNRKEFDDILHPDDYGLYFKMNTVNYDLRYNLPAKNNWNTSAGINGMYQHSKNLGSEVLIPAYGLFDGGIFIITKKTIGDVDIAGGIRYDHRTLHADPYYSEEQDDYIFNAFRSGFSAVSGSVGATWQMDDHWYSKLNFSRGFRAPNMAELGSNGIHEGTFRYEKGNQYLQAETSFQTDLALGYNSEHVTFEADIFNNAIQHFIFLQKLISVTGTDSLIESDGNYYPVFSYTQGNANLSGGEISIDIHPHPFDWLHFENSFSMVNAVQKNATDSTRYLPFTPAPKWITELRAEIKNEGGILANAYVQIQSENYFAQDHIYSAYDTETVTPGYSLINFGCGADIQSHHTTVCSVYFSANNITDTAYQSHLSRLKYADMNMVTGRSGVFNAGRNFSIKVNVPITVKS